MAEIHRSLLSRVRSSTSSPWFKIFAGTRKTFLSLSRSLLLWQPTITQKTITNFNPRKVFNRYQSEFVYSRKLYTNTADSNRCQESGHVRANQELAFFVDPDLLPPLPPPPPPLPGEGGTHIKRGGMLVVSLRGVNFGFCSQLGCSEQNAIICSRQGLL